MSHYVECDPNFDAEDVLIAALVECGFPTEQIEIHGTPTGLYGYEGKLRSQKAHIVIRREHVGPSANDVGFEFRDGRYIAHISEFDLRNRFNNKAMDQLKREYAIAAVRLREEAAGRIVNVVRQGQTAEITVTGYR